MAGGPGVVRDSRGDSYRHRTNQSLLTMVPVAVAGSPRMAGPWVTPVSVTERVSSGSTFRLPVTGIVMVLVVTPAAKLTTPVPAV
jgi:hypothetical protein